MTRSEAITVLKAFMDNPLFSDIHKAAFNIAIHDIEAYHKWNLNELVLRPKEENTDSLVNEHIVDLISNLIGYMQGYVGSANCPYKYNLLEAENIDKPKNCSDCEKCKHDFWLHLESELLDKNVVE